MTEVDQDLCFLQQAARLAIRGHGGAEPNPLVGCVIASPNRECVAWGYHRTFGGPHAEIVALERAGRKARGATLYCTLEPCNHSGKTPPCTDAIINAGISRVVIARRDPHESAQGGAERLRAAGIQVDPIESCTDAFSVSDPFVYRVETGLPWVIAKWAQTLDGKIATRSGESKWISNEHSRRLVHRERGRVDAILTGIGTVLADDPLLTARQVRVRRRAKRIVIDPRLEIPLESQLISTTDVAPTIVFTMESAADQRKEHINKLESCGVEVVPIPADGSELPMKRILQECVLRYDIMNVLVESGPGLMHRLFRDQLVNEAWVFIAPTLLGDDQAPASVSDLNINELRKSIRMRPYYTRTRCGDVCAKYRVKSRI